MAYTAVHTKKKKTHGNIFLRIILSVLAAYSIVVLVDMQISQAQKRQELAEITNQVEQQRLLNKEMKRRLTSELDEGYIERRARDELGYVASDEKVFIDISGS